MIATADKTADITWATSDPTQYLTGVSNDYLRQLAEDNYGLLGILLGPGTFGGPGSKCNYASHLSSYRNWALDNGCFSNHGAFDESRWLNRLAWILDNVEGAHEGCLFAVAPDVYDPVAGRGEALPTIQRSLPVLPKIRQLGVPAALVLQDGVQHHQNEIPWGQFDVAFIGGSDDFKMGYYHYRKSGNPHYQVDRRGAISRDTKAFMRMIQRCYREGVEVHVGRVSSWVRYAYSISIGAASCDGTFFSRAGRKGVPQLRRWWSELGYEVAGD